MHCHKFTTTYINNVLYDKIYFCIIFFPRELNTTYLNELGVEMMKGYADPYHGRQVYIARFYAAAL